MSLSEYFAAKRPMTSMDSEEVDELAPLPLADGGGVEPPPEMMCFRVQTAAILSHYFEISAQLGRVLSMLGREFFQARISHHAVPSFENQALFVHDVRRCLERLDAHAYDLIQLSGYYGLNKEDIAAQLGQTRVWVCARFAEALDQLSEIFLEAGLLKASAPDRHQQQMKGRPLPADLAVLPPKKACASAPAGYAQAEPKRVPANARAAHGARLALSM